MYITGTAIRIYLFPIAIYMYEYHAFFEYSDVDEARTSALCHARISKILPDDDNFANICKNLDRSDTSSKQKIF